MRLKKGFSRELLLLLRYVRSAVTAVIVVYLVQTVNRDTFCVPTGFNTNEHYLVQLRHDHKLFLASTSCTRIKQYWLRSFGFVLSTLSLVTGNVAHCSISNDPGPCLWTQTILCCVFASVCAQQNENLPPLNNSVWIKIADFNSRRSFQRCYDHDEIPRVLANTGRRVQMCSPPQKPYKTADRVDLRNQGYSRPLLKNFRPDGYKKLWEASWLWVLEVTANSSE